MKDAYGKRERNPHTYGYWQRDMRMQLGHNNWGKSGSNTFRSAPPSPKPIILISQVKQSLAVMGMLCYVMLDMFTARHESAMV